MGFLYKDKPFFGLDIGRSSVKVMQLTGASATKPTVSGYGTIGFDPKILDRGVISDRSAMVRVIYELLNRRLVGKITTDRVAVSVPNTFSFSRVISLPKMSASDLAQAVELEVDQSIPMPADQIYYDYSVTREINEDEIEIQIVACPSKIIDSYIDVFGALGISVSLIEPNISAVTRTVMYSEAHEVSSLIVDIGSSACDISIYDGSAIRVTGTVDCSAERITQNIADQLGISLSQAQSIKTRYGLEVSKKQKQITEAVEPELNKLVAEIKKVMRYFADKERSSNPIGQIIILGGGANLPGLSGFLTDRTRIPARLCSPWNNISFGDLQPPHELESTLYTTASGLSLASAKEAGRS